MRSFRSHMVPYSAWREKNVCKTMFIPENLLEFLGFLWQKGRKKRLKRPIIREYHRHRGPQRTEQEENTRKAIPSANNKKQQKVSKKREVLRKIIESSIF